MEGSELQDDDRGHDPGLSEAPTGAPAPETDDDPAGAPAAEEGEVNESHPNEGEIEEAVKDTDLADSPADAAEDTGE